MNAQQAPHSIDSNSFMLQARREALQDAIDAAADGNLSLFARTINQEMFRKKGLRSNISASTVWYWLHKSRKGVSDEYVLATEAVSDVSRQRLRPDLYGSPTPTVNGRRSAQ